LREIPDAPPFLYARGDISLLRNPAVAVVGTRHVSDSGKRSAGALAGGLAASGVTIVSGLAKGVDAEAHRAAMSLPGGTIAVLGTGIDVAYPAVNQPLYEKICEDGLVLSEFAPHAKADAKHFPIRNRLISGLSLGTLVIEAALGSGSLATTVVATASGEGADDNHAAEALEEVPTGKLAHFCSFLRTKSVSRNYSGKYSRAEV
jgi:DNA processing protein